MTPRTTENYSKPSLYYRERMVARLLKLTSVAYCDRMDDIEWKSNKQGDHFPTENGKILSTWLGKQDYAYFCTEIAKNIRNKNCQMVSGRVATLLPERNGRDTTLLVLSTKSMYNPVIKQVIEFKSTDDLTDFLEGITDGY